MLQSHNLHHRAHFAMTIVVGLNMNYDVFVCLNCANAFIKAERERESEFIRVYTVLFLAALLPPCFLSPGSTLLPWSVSSTPVQYYERAARAVYALTNTHTHVFMLCVMFLFRMDMFSCGFGWVCCKLVPDSQKALKV